MNAEIDISGIIIKTERLVLREWNSEDVEDMYEYASVPNVGEMAGWSYHKSIEESREIVKAFIESKREFAIEYNGKVIGSLGVEKYDENDFIELADKQGREIGYVLSKDYWGNGLMPEAVKAVINWLFDEKKLDFLICAHFEGNLRSKRVIEKCGFEYLNDIVYNTQDGRSIDALSYIIWNNQV